MKKFTFSFSTLRSAVSNHQSLHPLLPQSQYSGQGKTCGGQEEDPDCLSGEWGAAPPGEGRWAVNIKIVTQLKSVHIMRTTIHSHRADLGWWEVGVAPYQVVQDRTGDTAGNSIYKYLSMTINTEAGGLP